MGQSSTGSKSGRETRLIYKMSTKGLEGPLITRLAGADFVHAWTTTKNSAPRKNAVRWCSLASSCPSKRHVVFDF